MIGKWGFLPIFIIVLGMGLAVRFVDMSGGPKSMPAPQKMPEVQFAAGDFAAIEPSAGPAKEEEKDKNKDEEKNTDKDANGKEEVKGEGEEAPALPADKEAPDLFDMNDADITVLRQLAERRRELDAREKSLEKREAMFQAAQGELKQKYSELDKLRTEIKELLDIQSEEEEKRLKSLVVVYEGMKPKEAAAILNEMDLEILIQVFGRMSERKMSPIMAAMNPARAREITINLAIQKKLPEEGKEPVKPVPTQ